MTREKIPYATIPHISQISFAVRQPQEIIYTDVIRKFRRNHVNLVSTKKKIIEDKEVWETG